MGRATKEIRKRIEKKEEKLGRELTKQEKRKIEKTVTRRVRRENAIRAAFFAIGIGIGGLSVYGGERLLEEHNRSKIEEEKKAEARKQFLEGVSISPEALGQESEQIENTEERDVIQKEVDNLESQEDILNYIKEIYVEEYNKKHEDKISKEQLFLKKSRYDYTLNYSQAQNGNSIIRYSTDTNKSGLDTSKGVISSEIKTEDGIKKEKVFNNYGYQTIYSEEEVVESYSDNFLTQVAEMVDKGIDWYTAFPQENTPEKLKEEYKKQFVDAICKYKNKEKAQAQIQENDETERY